LPVETSMKACGESAASVSRIITPTLVHASVPLIPDTRAVIVASPVICRYA
jgi:hypothetical protein